MASEDRLKDNAGRWAKEKPRFEAGLRRVSQHGSFLPRRQDNPRKPSRFRLYARVESDSDIDA
jgi:hypothetical protein